MNHLEELRKIKEEVSNKPFSYENVHRIMHLVYVAKEHFTASVTVPNKEIGLHQLNKISKNDFHSIIKSSNTADLKTTYTNLITNFKLVLDYI